MLLYHGTTLEIKEPKIIKGDIGRDFGLFVEERLSSNN